MFSFRIFRNILKISLLKSGKKSIKFIFIRFIHFKKLEIIISLTDEANIKEVLEDFKVYSTYPLPSINRMLVQAIYYISKKDINLANICIEKLIDFFFRSAWPTLLWGFGLIFLRRGLGYCLGKKMYGIPKFHVNL